MKKETLGLVIIFGGIGMLAYVYFQKNKPSIDKKQLETLNQGSTQLVDMTIVKPDWGFEVPPNPHPNGIPDIVSHQFAQIANDPVKAKAFADQFKIDNAEALSVIDGAANLSNGGINIGAIDWSNLNLLDNLNINLPLT